MNFEHLSDYLKVVKVIEQRDHSGRFSKPEFKKSSYFKLQLSFVEKGDLILAGQ